jgi:mRNA interferase MazF
MVLLKRGAVCWVRLDPTEGSEIGKTRPAVIVSNDINNELADTVTVVPITASTRRIYPFEVLIPKGGANLKESSKAKANQIRTIDKNRVSGVIGFLPNSSIAKIESAIKIHLAME